MSIFIQIILVLWLFVASYPLTYSQSKLVTTKMVKKQYRYGDVVPLKINERVVFEDSLSILFSGTSYNRRLEGQSSKIIIKLSISKNNEALDTIELFSRGIQGELKDKDGISDVDRYSSLGWNEYSIQLKHFNYNPYIGIKIRLLKKDKMLCVENP